MEGRMGTGVKLKFVLQFSSDSVPRKEIAIMPRDGIVYAKALESVGWSQKNLIRPGFSSGFDSGHISDRMQDICIGGM